MVVLLCVLAFDSVRAPAPLAEQRVPETNTLATSSDQMDRALPTLLAIPAIDLEAPFTAPLGLKDNGEIEVPSTFDEVGWYKYGPTPGEIGPAVILGHVDSYKGKAVLWSLGQLEVGDVINVTRADGSMASFIVEKLERYSQADFPTVDVYGPIDYAGLRVITCTGTYSRQVDRYSHNLVVYARLSTSTSSYAN